MLNLLNIFAVTSFVAIFISGINRDTITLSILCSVPAICIGLVKVIKEKGRIYIPKNFVWMVIFVIILQIDVFFVKDKFNPSSYVAIFIIGIIYWLIFYNLGKGRDILQSLIINLSLIYSLLYFITKVFNIDLIKFADLFYAEGLGSRHYHIGDLWAFTLLLIIGTNWNNFKLKTWLLVDIGFLFLVLSNARSAYLSLILGFLYLITRKIGNGNYKNIIPGVFIALVVALFMFASASKTTLLSRPYFLQSVESFAKYPFGIGMGNFKQIGIEYYVKNGDASKFSLYTHNIFLEALSGVGIFSLFFLKFLYSIALNILREKKINLEWGALIIAILTNFMFDTTYTIPGMIWIMFMALGVYSNRSLNPKNLNSNSS